MQCVFRRIDFFDPNKLLKLASPSIIKQKEVINLDKKQKWISCGAVSIAIVFLAITAVTASSLKLSNTPLYTFRMEKASSDQNFLPVEMSNFAYSAERGSRLGYDASGGTCVDAPLATGLTQCLPECPPSEYSTCCYTCSYTCVNTCSTCVSTCSSTCVNTCRTCVNTCVNTCAATC